MKKLREFLATLFWWRIEPFTLKETTPQSPSMEELALAAFINREAIDRLLELRQSVSIDISATSGEVRVALWDVVRQIDTHLTELSGQKSL